MQGRIFRVDKAEAAIGLGPLEARVIVRAAVEAARMAQADAAFARAGLRPQLGISATTLDANLSQLGMPVASQAYVGVTGSLPLLTPSAPGGARVGVDGRRDNVGCRRGSQRRVLRGGAGVPPRTAFSRDSRYACCSRSRSRSPPRRDRPTHPRGQSAPLPPRARSRGAGRRETDAGGRSGRTGRSGRRPFRRPCIRSIDAAADRHATRSRVDPRNARPVRTTRSCASADDSRCAITRTGRTIDRRRSTRRVLANGDALRRWWNAVGQ